MLSSYNKKSVINLGNKINKITNDYLKKSSKIFYSVIPDKSYFIENSIFNKSDYAKLLKILNKTVNSVEYISIMNTLELTDYYKTDLHWRQEKIIDTINILGKKMNFKIDESDFKKRTLKPYEGVYAPYIKDAVPNESLIYLTNKYTKNATVQVYGVSGTSPVYNLEKWKSNVPYDLFLSGPLPIVTVTGKASDSKELIIFGDSFSSSLAPLLLKSYSKITLVDLRFVSSQFLSQWIDFHGQDVLFLYNTAVVNNSFMLK